MASNITTDQFLAAAKYRRTVYALKPSSPVSDSRIEEVLKEILSFAPSSYNTQSARFTLVLGDKHKQFWDIVSNESEEILKGAGAWEAMSPRFQAFGNAYGSVSSYLVVGFETLTRFFCASSAFALCSCFCSCF